MGCAGSRFDELPVTGHATGLVVLPESRDKYLSAQPTVLKLREKFFSFSGDDCSIKVTQIFDNIVQIISLCHYMNIRSILG